jgi:CRP-like cAMP-binding protein
MSEHLDVNELARHALFSNIPVETIRTFMDCLGRQAFEPGARIIQENEQGNCLFIIEQGNCEVRKRVLTKDGICEQAIATLKPGETFGEMELVDQQPRSASVVALGAVRVLCLSAHDLQARTGSDYKTFSLVLMNLAREISLRLRRTDLWLAGSLFCVHKNPPG